MVGQVAGIPCRCRSGGRIGEDEFLASRVLLGPQISSDCLAVAAPGDDQRLAGRYTAADGRSVNVEVAYFREQGDKGELVKDVTYDIGGLYYLYAGNSYDKVSTANANTFELYGALTAGVFTLKAPRYVTTRRGPLSPGTLSQIMRHADYWGSLPARAYWLSAFTVSPMSLARRSVKMSRIVSPASRRFALLALFAILVCSVSPFASASSGGE